MDEKNNRTEKQTGRTRKIFRGVVNFLKREEKIIINKEQIGLILPHRGRMLLLDRVVITAQKIMGEFIVTNEVCDGHAVLEGKLVLKGSDLFDMAAQLLGVWAAQHSDAEFKGKKTVIREYGGAKFRNPIFPKEFLVMEIDPENASAQVMVGRDIIITKGEKFSARVGKEKKAEISSVELIIY